MKCLSWRNFSRKGRFQKKQLFDRVRSKFKHRYYSELQSTQCKTVIIILSMHLALYVLDYKEYHMATPVVHGFKVS